MERGDRTIGREIEKRMKEKERKLWRGERER
jgi:hypothetical protein